MSPRVVILGQTQLELILCAVVLVPMELTHEGWDSPQ
jgi:hypothetical protein